jgi:hypothetical protein
MRRKDKLENIKKINLLIEAKVVTDKLTEIFGWSKKEKEEKALIEKVEQAKKEIDKVDVSYFWKQPGSNPSNAEYKKLINIIIYNLKSELPTFVKLFPNILDNISENGTNAVSARYDYNGKVLQGITLSSLSPYLLKTTYDNIDDKSKDRLKMFCDDLLSKD